jgi:hypothetical protein
MAKTNAERQAEYKARNADSLRLDVILPQESANDLREICEAKNLSQRDALIYILGFCKATLTRRPSQDV